MQELLGFDIGSYDWQALVQQAREYALPRLGQSLLQLLAAAIVFVVARWILALVQRRIAARTKTEVDDHIVEALRRIALISVWFWAFWRITHIWDMPRLTTVVGAIWLVALTLPIAKMIQRLLEIVEHTLVAKTESKLDDTALPWVNRLLSWGVIAIGAVMALEQLGVEIGPFIAGASVLGVAVSFAAKDTLSNLIAGVLLIVDRPFEVGDRIEIWGAPQNQANWGDITEIGIRATKIRTPDNLIVIIPNNEIMRRDIVNYTASGATIRLRIPIGIAYDADVDEAKKYCLQAAEDCAMVKRLPEPVCILRAFGASSVDLELRVWLEDARERRAADDWLTERIKQLFDANGIEIPYPKRDLYIRQTPESGAAPLAPPKKPALPEADREPPRDPDPSATKR